MPAVKTSHNMGMMPERPRLSVLSNWRGATLSVRGTGCWISSRWDPSVPFRRLTHQSSLKKFFDAASRFPDITSGCWIPPFPLNLSDLSAPYLPSCILSLSFSRLPSFICWSVFFLCIYSSLFISISSYYSLQLPLTNSSTALFPLLFFLGWKTEIDGVKSNKETGGEKAKELRKGCVCVYVRECVL